MICTRKKHLFKSYMKTRLVHVDRVERIEHIEDRIRARSYSFHFHLELFQLRFDSSCIRMTTPANNKKRNENVFLRMCCYDSIGNSIYLSLHCVELEHDGSGVGHGEILIWGGQFGV